VYKVTYCVNEYAERQEAGEFEGLSEAQEECRALWNQGYAWPTVWYPDGRKSVITSDGFTKPELVK